MSHPRASTSAAGCALVLAWGILPGMPAAAGDAAQTGPTAATAATAAAAGVVVSEAWIRWLPANLPAGGYATLRNRSARTAAVTGASSPLYAAVSMHRSVDRNGVSIMQPVDSIPIPARGALSFAAAGYHLMLEQPVKTLGPGDTVPITLHFADGSSLTASFVIRSPAAGTAPP